MSREDTIQARGKNFEMPLDAFAKVIIGDENSLSFRPSARYSAFGEDGTGLVLHTPTSKNIQPVLERGIVGWDDFASNIGARFYSHQDKGRWERGAVEHELILYALPASGDIPFSIEVSGLDLVLQGPLSDVEIARGNTRPLEMIGGFCAYHQAKGVLHGIPGEADRYKAGKAFDIPIPTATDANGIRVTGSWNYQPAASLLVSVFDFGWLEKAAYPVVIGPTIGYTSLGASIDVTGKFALANPFVAGASGDANPGTAFIGGASSGGATVYAAVYDNGDGNISANNRLAVSTGIVVNATAAFRSAAITWTGILNGSTYFLEVYSNTTDFTTRYDNTGATNQYTSTGAVATPPDPHAARSGTQTITPSIYIDFTSGGGGASVVPQIMNANRQRRVNT